jgi:hypothetical protein
LYRCIGSIAEVLSGSVQVVLNGKLLIVNN